MLRCAIRCGWLLAAFAVAGFGLGHRVTTIVSATPNGVAETDRSPVDVALSPDGKWLLSANQTSGTVSLVSLDEGRVVAEAPAGQRPSAVVLVPDGSRAIVSATYSGELRIFDVDGPRLEQLATIPVGSEPRGIAVSPDARWAYVAITAANSVAVIDLEAQDVVAQIEVGRWPRYLCLTPDGKRLAVGCSGDGGISVVDTEAREKLYDSKFVGLNIGQLVASSDGMYAYAPWMVYADRPINQRNIREGWVLGNRLTRVRLDGPARREAMALDPRGRAVADPHGMALGGDERWAVLTASGTHELVALRLEDLPLQTDGPGDHMPPDLAADSERLFRVSLGGRPMGICTDAEGRHVYVANYLLNAVQVVDLAERRLEREIPLGGPAEPSLARRGEAIFYDALRSTDGWYSCHSCHYEGHTNAVTMDTNNDGSFGTYKMVLSLRNLPHTSPWFWHGLQDDLPAALRKSLADTMQGPPPTDEDVQALASFLGTLEGPPSAPEAHEGELSEEARRGRDVFQSAAANCASCHSGPYFTDGQVHDVGLGSRFDAHEGFNTPSLLGVANRVRYLHHGRALSLDDLLGDLHSPEKVSGTRELTAHERADLVAYLESL